MIQQIRPGDSTQVPKYSTGSSCPDVAMYDSLNSTKKSARTVRETMSNANYCFYGMNAKRHIQPADLCRRNLMPPGLWRTPSRYVTSDRAAAAPVVAADPYDARARNASECSRCIFQRCVPFLLSVEIPPRRHSEGMNGIVKRRSQQQQSRRPGLPLEECFCSYQRVTPDDTPRPP